jgi:hypothetical protein
LGALPNGTIEHPEQSPLFHAENSLRYDRQSLISEYEALFSCRLAVIFDMIWPISISFFEELIYDMDKTMDLHIMLMTPGGDGESAVRLARSAQDRCNELTVLIPDQAKSAGTILALGAHRILMGPTSDLGPIDPQLQLANQTWTSAKDIIAALSAAEAAVQEKPATYPIHAALLADVTALMIQQARSALARSSDLMKEALASNPDRTTEEVKDLCMNLQEPLISLPNSHAALLDKNDAKNLGLPVEIVDPNGDQWRIAWRLWTKYLVAGLRIYEGSKASKIAGTWNQS